MSIEVLSLRNFPRDENAIDVAFPVFAIECEVSPLLENELDAYEFAALKLVSIGHSANGISKALNIKLSLAEHVLFNLGSKKFITRNVGQNWKLTEDANKYFEGKLENRPSGGERFGYMFVSALKKDVLQYFHEGNIGKIARSDYKVTKSKLLLDDENVTFSLPETPKIWQLKKAYNSYLRNIELKRKRENEDVSIQEAQDAYADYESFGEADYEDAHSQHDAESHIIPNKIDLVDGHKNFVRPLKRPLEKLYLHMRIIISPQVPGGFIVESPLAMDNIDSEFFQMQVKWMKNSKEVKFKDMCLSEFLDCEVNKLSRHKTIGEKDKSVSILERLPLLATQKDRYSRMYDDVSEIYDLMGKNLSQIARENIVGALNRKLIETLLNLLLKTAGTDTLRLVMRKALSDIKVSGIETIVANIANLAKINREILTFDENVFKNSINKLTSTCGNSVVEKLCNILIVFTYIASPEIKHFISQPGLDNYIKIIIKLNKIRNPASHATDKAISQKDYDFYIAHVFDVANRLFESLKEATKYGKKEQKQ